jgi:hypothetical protein
MENQNPLKKHFRRPAIYFKLPSRGKFWAESDIELSATGDIPIFPMTTGDEITLKTPDGLMNGSSVVEVIHSCCPSIKNAWGMPAVDIDATLIAIRIASYSSEMEMGTICPHCNNQNDYVFNLTAILDQIKCPDFTTPIMVDGLEVKLKPQTYQEITQTNIKSYEEQRIIDAIKNSDLSETDRNIRVKESVERIVRANELSLLASTEYIKTEDGDVISDKAFIKEFYDETSAKTVKTIRDKLDELNKAGALPSSTIKCAEEECGKEFTVPLTFDYSSFFAISS